MRSRLDSVIEALGYTIEKDKEKEKVDSQEESLRRQDILEALGRGEITAQEAAHQMRKIDK